MAISVQKAKELYLRLKAKFLDTLDQEEFAKHEEEFLQRLHSHQHDQDGHDHSHGHDHGHHHSHGQQPDHGDALAKRSEELDEAFFSSKLSQAVYCKLVFEMQSDMAREAFELAVAKGIVTSSFFSGVKSVASFGCGPAPELIGFQTFLGGLSKESVPTAGVELVGIDAAEGWRPYVEETGCKFQHKMIDGQFIKEMPKFDIILLVCSAHHLPFSKPVEGDRTMWDLLGGKARFIVVIDFNNKDQEAELKKYGFVQFQLREKHPLVEVFSINVNFKLN